MKAFAGRKSFDEETFHDVEAERADLRDCEFQRCSFRNVKLAESRWARARLDDCSFENCDLTRANVAELAFRGARFEGCKLMGVDLGAIGEFPDVSFTDCDLRYAAFVRLSLRRIEFVRCNIVEASFIETDLVEARFEECRFAGTTFESCDLRKAQFPSALDLHIDPTKNKIKDTRVPLETARLVATSFGFRIEG